MLLERAGGPPAASTAAAHGTLIVVVGPSGAGKDSLIGYARQRLAAEPSVLFVRRVVTRPANPAAEDHDCLSPAEFTAAEHAGAFAVTWEAHGLRYGVPSAVRRHVQGGGVAIANGSRAALPAIGERFRPMIVVHVTARPDVLAWRLAQRRREGAAEIEKRLLRAPSAPAATEGFFEIDNSGELAAAGDTFVALVQKIIAD